MKAENSLQQNLEFRIRKTRPGTILFPGDFLELGSPEALHMAFSRLTERKYLSRIAKGIYVVPQVDPILGSVLPSLEDVAKAIAKREKVVIRPTGAYALNRLGLSTQVPTKVVFLTNGSRRTIRIGKGKLSFKPTTPKKLAAVNETVFLAIQALIALGKKGINDRVLQILTEKLRSVSPTQIREDARNAPQEISKILFKIAAKMESYD